GVTQDARVLDGGGADDHVGDPVVEVMLDGVEVADASADLDRDVFRHGVHDGLDGGGILRLAGNGAVEVDQVQAACALIEPLFGDRGGGLGENGCVVEVALAKANAAPVLQVDGGNQEHDESADKMRENGFRHPPPQWLVWRAEKEGLSRSGLPFCKVAIEPEAVVGTLFGVKLHGKNVICCNGTGKALAVMTNPYSQARILRNRKVAVNEIEGGAVGDAGPQHVVAHLDDGVPAHVRHLEPGACRLPCGRCAREG